MDTSLADTADLVFGEWLRTRYWRFCCLQRWWLARGDSASLQNVITYVTGLDPSPGDTAGWGWVSRTSRVHLDLVRGDTVAALQGLAEFRIWPEWNNYSESLTLAQVLAQGGNSSEAAEVLEQLPTNLSSHPLPWQVIWRLERARVHEDLGNEDRAITDYQFVVDAWRYADDILQPQVTEAREALVRLTAEPRGN